MATKMTHADIRQIFEDVYKGSTNLMTPDVIGYGKKGRFIYELSEGRGIMGDNLYGVTVLTLTGEKTKLSKCFRLKAHAGGYASRLNQQSEEHAE